LPQQRRRSRPDLDAPLRTQTRPLPKLYSRGGFAHHYRPWDSQDIPQVLSQYWQQVGKTYDPHRPADAASVVTIAGITAGNFRLVEGLMNQVARIMTMNNSTPSPPTPSKPPAKSSSAAPDQAR